MKGYLGKTIRFIKRAHYSNAEGSRREYLSVSPWRDEHPADAIIVEHILKVFVDNISKMAGLIPRHYYQALGKMKEPSKGKCSTTYNHAINIDALSLSLHFVDLHWQKLTFINEMTARQYNHYIWTKGYQACVKDIPLCPEAAELLVINMREIRKAYSDATKTVEETNKALEAHNKKWDLVEELVGLRRLQSGALVPKNNHQACCSPFEPICSCDCPECVPR